MPAKNSVKTYIKNGYYHVYNRGVEKRKIFLYKQDYSVFLAYLKQYLSYKDVKKLRSQLNKVDYKEKDKIVKTLRMNNFNEDIRLLCFCLMPNHFHFLIQQKKEDSMDKFMNSLCTRYTMYFNKKYKRVGSLFQGVYKAVLIDNDNYLTHLSRYIHFQAVNARCQRPSSFDAYLGKSSIDWVNKDVVLSYFPKTNKNLSYENFVMQTKVNSFDHISKLLID